MENEPKVEGSTCGTSALSAGLGVADPSCFNCDALGGGLYRVHEGPTQWFVGHADGGGQYACADCKDLLFDALPIATPNVEFSGTSAASSPEAPLERHVSRQDNFISAEMLKTALMTPEQQALVEQMICPKCGVMTLLRKHDGGGMLFNQCSQCLTVWVLTANV